MIPEQLDEYLELPGPRRKWKRIVDELCEGKSAIWLFPSTIFPEAFYRKVMGEAGRRGLSFSLFLCDVESGLPGSFIAREIGLMVEPGNTIRVEQLMEGDFLPEPIAWRPDRVCLPRHCC